jgi:hypothetical protein
MGMGHYAAVNIHQHILSGLYGTTPKYVHWPKYPPMIALAVGKQSIMYTPTDGVKSGEDVNKACFGDDLGLTSKSFDLVYYANARLTYPQYVRTICS